MIIGLVRHFKVKYKNYSPFYYPGGYLKAMQEYDEADVLPVDTNLNGIDWETCLSSTFKRARITAEHIYHNEIIFTDLLREVSLSPFTKRNICLPWFVWHIGARIAWHKGSASQEESRLQTLNRAEKIFSIIKDSEKEKILIVSHGFFMKNLVSKLRRKGFTGNIDEIPENGKLYLFENKSFRKS